MDELVERLMLFGYAEEDAETIIEDIIDEYGYMVACDYITTKERELYVY